MERRRRRASGRVARLVARAVLLASWVLVSGGCEGKTAFKTSVSQGGLKLIHDLADGRFELYDLVADPEELRDLHDTGQPAEATLTKRLEAWEQSRREGRAETPARRYTRPYRAGIVPRLLPLPSLVDRLRAYDAGSRGSQGR